MKLIFIGDHFYEESRSTMSSLYTEEGARSDWGKVQHALRNGEAVSIRPANASEYGEYEKRLRALKTLEAKSGQVPRGTQV